jgi:hypothetical protein
MGAKPTIEKSPKSDFGDKEGYQGYSEDKVIIGSVDGDGYITLG